MPPRAQAPSPRTPRGGCQDSSSSPAGAPALPSGWTSRCKRQPRAGTRWTSPTAPGDAPRRPRRQKRMSCQGSGLSCPRCLLLSPELHAETWLTVSREPVAGVQLGSPTLLGLPDPVPGGLPNRPADPALRCPGVSWACVEGGGLPPLLPVTATGQPCPRRSAQVSRPIPVPAWPKPPPLTGFFLQAPGVPAPHRVPPTNPHGPLLPPGG